MAGLTLADGTGAIECAVFPNAYERLSETSQEQSSLREGAFVVARGRVAWRGPYTLGPDPGRRDLLHANCGGEL